jgi:hypothetical protein
VRGVCIARCGGGGDAASCGCMLGTSTSYPTGMPILDAQADFRRARRAHAVARIGRWVSRRGSCSCPRWLEDVAAMPGGAQRLEVVSLSSIVGTLEQTLGANRARAPQGSGASTGRPSTGSGRLLRRRWPASSLRRTGARSPGHRRLGRRRLLTDRLSPLGVLPHGAHEQVGGPAARARAERERNHLGRGLVRREDPEPRRRHGHAIR